MKMNGSHVVLSFVCLVLGFMLVLSYQMTKKEAVNRQLERQWNKEYEYRQQLIEQQEQNRKLQAELFDKQQRVREIEKELANEEQVYFNLVEDAERLRMYLGKVKGKRKRSRSDVIRRFVHPF
ncbi:MAG: hypothetical protein KatS3mg080_0260 [Anoxybacillus sp.]|nr:MAG: hypothetical protein KatS3mg080_0260 [Anoxybacillus sp.]